MEMHDGSHRDRSSQFVASFYAKARHINYTRLLSPTLALAICALLLLALQKISQSIDYHSVSRQLFCMAPDRWAAALAATVLSFAALVARDEIGLRHVEAKVPKALLWIGATAASALGNIAGFGALTGAAVRCRVYGAAGVTPSQVGRLTLFSSG